MDNIETARRPAQGPKFVTGSLLRHILTMTGAGAVGLMAIFVGDLANSDIVTDQTFWVGVYPALTDEMLDYVIASVKEFVGGHS